MSATFSYICLPQFLNKICIYINNSNHKAIMKKSNTKEWNITYYHGSNFVLIYNPYYDHPTPSVHGKLNYKNNNVWEFLLNPNSTDFTNKCLTFTRQYVIPKTLGTLFLAPTVKNAGDAMLASHNAPDIKTDFNVAVFTEQAKHINIFLFKALLNLHASLTAVNDETSSHNLVYRLFGDIVRHIKSFNLEDENFNKFLSDINELVVKNMNNNNSNLTLELINKTNAFGLTTD